MEKLKSVYTELVVLELELDKKLIDGKDLLGICENELEEYLIESKYNVYDNSRKDLTMDKVYKDDLTVDSTLISDTMSRLGFDKLEKDDKVFYFIEDEHESKIIEIAREVVGSGRFSYRWEDSDHADECCIYIEEINNKEHMTKLTYSYENDNYVQAK